MPAAVEIAYVWAPDAEPLGVRRHVGRALMRRLVDERFGAGAVSIETAASGQPIVVGAPLPAFVSLTHTDRLVAAALANGRVGIDAEPLDRVPTYPGLAERVCSPAELSWLSQRVAEPNRDFLRLWTRKESYGKAIGVGLGFEWRSTSFNPDDRCLAGVAGEWQASELEFDVGVVAAVVVEGGPRRIAVTKVDRRDIADLG